ncbi:hypothetical protein Y032_0079g1225 [Ancylostoma ceylanicum]|uniref:Uncharacterized protein n=1 Tax=Ancylostoma ceylanicum TaxID=53326 RepID=A0A016TST7_9BILA|nr:hypothetical protein Y032_0079g1225 [Ancylostoma ceylanicum]
MYEPECNEEAKAACIFRISRPSMSTVVPVGDTKNIDDFKEVRVKPRHKPIFVNVVGYSRYLNIVVRCFTSRLSSFPRRWW